MVQQLAVLLLLKKLPISCSSDDFSPSLQLSCGLTVFNSGKILPVAIAGKRPSYEVCK